MSVKDEVLAFKKSMLSDRLSQISVPQRELFDRIFPGGPRDEQLETAIDLCDRTILKNTKDPTRLNVS